MKRSKIKYYVYIAAGIVAVACIVIMIIYKP